MRVVGGLLNLLWLALILGFAIAGWTNALLGLIAISQLDLGLDFKAFRQQIKPMTDVFADDYDADAAPALPADFGAQLANRLLATQTYTTQTMVVDLSAMKES